VVKADPTRMERMQELGDMLNLLASLSREHPDMVPDLMSLGVESPEIRCVCVCVCVCVCLGYVSMCYVHGCRVL